MAEPKFAYLQGNSDVSKALGSRFVSRPSPCAALTLDQECDLTTSSKLRKSKTYTSNQLARQNPKWQGTAFKSYLIHIASTNFSLDFQMLTFINLLAGRTLQ